MLDSLRSRIAVAALVIVVGVILMIVLFSYLGNGIIFPGDSGEDSNNSKRIIAYLTTFNDTDKTTLPTFSFVKIQGMPNDSAIRFLNPFGKAMSHFPQIMTTVPTIDPNSAMTKEQEIALLKDADVFEQYILIRLPDELGGAEQNVGAFRAYSDLDPDSKCLLRYQHHTDTGRYLVDPCHSDIFRVTDGYSCFGRIIGSNPALSGYNAIPRMRLSVDDQGYLLAIKPDGQPHGDGTVGEGRVIPIEEIKSNDTIDSSCAPNNPE